MRTPPEALDEADLVLLLTEAWHFSVVDLRYAPVGFGSHHWVAIDQRGARRFVTVDDLDGTGPDDGAGLARLRRALRTAYALREAAGLSFVVAPLAAGNGDVLRPLGSSYAAAVYPFVAGAPYPGDEHSTPQDRTAVVRLLAQLHAATPTARELAGVDDLDVAGRADLQTALDQLSVPWTGGPFAEPTRELLTAGAADLRRLLQDHDRRRSRVLASNLPWVITHGEPKADNLLATAVGPVLLDWDTALLAPAARDLWMVAGGFGEEEQAYYAELTGRCVPSDDLAFYRLRWDLADIADFVRWFAAPHARTADSEIAWNALSHLLRLRERWPRLLGPAAV